MLKRLNVLLDLPYNNLKFDSGYCTYYNSTILRPYDMFAKVFQMIGEGQTNHLLDPRFAHQGMNRIVAVTHIANQVQYTRSNQRSVTMIDYMLPVKRRLKNLRTFMKHKVSIKDSCDPNLRLNFSNFVDLLKSISSQCKFTLRCVNLQSELGKNGLGLFICLELAYRDQFLSTYLLTLQEYGSHFDSFELVNFKEIKSLTTDENY